MLKAVFVALMVASVAIVAAKGRAVERLTAAVLVVATLASPLVQTTDFVGLEGGIMLVDASVLVFLVAVALRSDRHWPLWAAGFQLVGVSVHAARLAAPHVWFFAYSNAEIFWAYPVYLALIVGTLTEARRRPP